MRGVALVVVTALAAGARAQELDFEDLGPDEPTLTIERGRSPAQLGFALEIAGGEPFGCALLSLARDGSAESRSVVTLDGAGRARFVERDWSVREPVHVSCTFAPAPGASSGGVVRFGVIDPAPANPPLLPIANPGDVVICEIMKDPSFVADSAGEWFEIRNRSGVPINLDGWVIGDAGTNQHTIHDANGVWLGARAYFVLGINANPATNGGVAVGYKYSNFSLGNGADEIRLFDSGGTLVDWVAYDDGIFWPDEPGKSLNLDRALIDAGLNDDGANWCPALHPMGGGNTDHGTPRVANNTCP
jgi:hypothetical protein